MKSSPFNQRPKAVDALVTGSATSSTNTTPAAGKTVAGKTPNPKDTAAPMVAPRTRPAGMTPAITPITAAGMAAHATGTMISGQA